MVGSTVTVVHREFFRLPPEREAFAAPPFATAQPPVPVADWARVSGFGRRLGPPDARVTLVVFSDFECPACARFANRTLPALREMFPKELAVIFRHWPLRSHRLAYPAARAAECAAAEGKFEVFHNLIFSQQDSLGEKTFRQFAREAGVEDLAAFETCTAKATPVPAIEADIAEARRIGGTGTPTVVVDGLDRRVRERRYRLGMW